MPDDDGYPTDEETAEIRYWPMGPARPLIERLKELWWTPEFGFHLEDRADDAGGATRVLRLSTGGWSGNEELIAALRSSMGGMLWATCFELHRRGGHYELHINEMWWSQIEPSGFASRMYLSAGIAGINRLAALRTIQPPHWTDAERAAHVRAVDMAIEALSDETVPEVLAVVLAEDPVLRGGASVLARDAQGRRYLRHWRQGDPPIEPAPAHIEKWRTDRAAALKVKSPAAQS